MQSTAVKAKSSSLTAPAAWEGVAPKMKEDMRRLIPENIPCDVFSAVHVMEFCCTTPSLCYLVAETHKCIKTNNNKNE